MAQQVKIQETPVIDEEPVDEFDEAEFQSWYKDRAAKFGLDPNPDDPKHFYDYRAAHKAGAEPSPTDGHWPSEFKLEGHPNLIVDGKDTRTGEPVKKSIWRKAYDIANWPSERIASGIPPHDDGTPREILGPGLMKIPGIERLTDYIEHKIDPTDSPFYTGIRPFAAGAVKFLGDTLASGFDPRSAGIKEAAPEEAIIAARSKFKPKDIELPPSRFAQLREKEANGALVGDELNELIRLRQQDAGIQPQQSIDPNFNQGMGDPEMAGYVSPPHAVEPPINQPPAQPPQPPNIPPQPPQPPPVAPAVSKLREALKQAHPLNRQQREIYKAERAEKFARADRVEITDEESASKFMSQLAGKHTKVVNTPLQLDEADANSLFTIIGKHPDITVPEQAQAVTALRKIFEGAVPQPNEVRTLEAIFGEKLGDVIPRFKTRSRIIEAVNLSKVIQSAYDLSIPLRQARPLMHTKTWWTSWNDMVKSVGSQKSYDGLLESLMEKPLMKRTRNLKGELQESYAEKIGLSVTDLVNTREETAMSKWAMKIPGIKASNRGASAFLNKVRVDTLHTMVESNKRVADSARKLAKTAEEFAAADMLDPMKNLVLGKRIAKYINSATGRGDLGRFEKIAEELNLAFYSPKLIKSRMDFLNPRNYIGQSNAGLRKEYLKSALSLAVSWTTMVGAGALIDGETSLDPNSADFGKIKFNGTTRMDPGASFQQFLVLLARLRPQALGGGVTSSTTGEESQFGEGYKADTRKDAVIRFFENKLAPIPHYVWSPMTASEHRSFRPVDEAIRLAIPLMMQDLIEVAKEDPDLLPMVGISGILGLGAQTYGDKGESQTIVPEEFDFPTY